MQMSKDDKNSNTRNNNTITRSNHGGGGQTEMLVGHFVKRPPGRGSSFFRALKETNLAVT